ncbi:MAG: 50S ribosomal protein L24 [Candidatus Eisenbacteria bacterium]|uniref:Large ribosomal subunit protein uL24 n=1 Tax=Eiseniibacteriota bacterium TaxID=2212470 RepID=A0A538TCK2_UNCEI|nr:MAG: 50S ribosomal protein L24 [Candidatus Eisenbacteria bacterium]TMQ61358.1 MAG: 50S ribosomal protein L24 [Candidatus Eisenbacteria bacterium]
MSHFARNDQVVVIAGDDRGKSGRVLKVLIDEDRLIVEKVNFIKRHTKPRGQKVQGGILEREAPVHISNVMHLCPKCQMGVRVTMKRTADGKRERYCARCGETIPRVR